MKWMLTKFQEASTSYVGTPSPLLKHPFVKIVIQTVYGHRRGPLSSSSNYFCNPTVIANTIFSKIKQGCEDH